MSDHVHVWEPLFSEETIPSPWSEASWRCECADILTVEQVQRRLNATERLSGALAYTLAMEDTMPEGSTGGDALKAYAAALEGK